MINGGRPRRRRRRLRILESLLIHSWRFVLFMRMRYMLIGIWSSCIFAKQIVAHAFWYRCIQRKVHSCSNASASTRLINPPNMQVERTQELENGIAFTDDAVLANQTLKS